MPDPLSTFDQVFEDAGRSWNVDPRLLKAIATQESQGDPRAVSKKGAQGLMQIIPETQRSLGVTNPYDPVQSIYGAAKYLNEALDAEGTPERALLYYHGGPKWRDKFGPESQAYVPAVAAKYKALAGAQQPQPTQPALGASADAQAPPPPAPTQPPVAASGGPQDGAPLIIGDSLASKQGMGGSGVVGAAPSAVLASITALPTEQVQGHDVVLSSGASNNPAQTALVEQQIRALTAKGANSVTVVGVGDRRDLAGVNNALAAVTSKAGGRFVPLPAGSLSADRIHPTRAGYNALLASIIPRRTSY